MTTLFATTLFLASALLFVVEPMVGKMILPKFGGAPAVWNTCLVFFQALLLAGYGYAHLLTRWLSGRRQLPPHLLLALAPLLTLPVALSPRFLPPGGAHPLPWLLAMLLVGVGLPFFVLSTTAPLLQQWLAETGHPRAGDPYFLYAASNAGSMVGLLAYPTLIEPLWPLAAQSVAWTAGYLVLIALLVGCAVAVGRGAGKRVAAAPSAESPSPTATARRLPGKRPASTITRPDVATRLRWIALAFAPSSLLLSVTAYLSTDVSPVPLMWVVPLALYLLSFILVFSRLPHAMHRLARAAFPVAVLVQMGVDFSVRIKAGQSLSLPIAAHLATFFFAAMVCHGELARSRPPPRFLTEFYFWMSLGGVLGGLFNTFMAPVAFSSRLEYPLALAAACALAPPAWIASVRPRRSLDLIAPALIGLAIATLFFKSDLKNETWPAWAAVSLCALAVISRTRFGLSIAAAYLAFGFYEDVEDHVVYRERGFYGVVQVEGGPADKYFLLNHGRIRHGQQQNSKNAAIRDVPLLYYYPTGPIGQVFHAWPGQARGQQVAAVGLGVGSLAAYGRSGQRFDFFEIDPAVERIARDTHYFTYLQDSRADCRVVLGDARLSLEHEPDGRYGLIVVDAFSGDAIPVHLLTRQAMEVYLAKLRGDGLLAFHVSNQFLDLAPVLGNLAADLHLVGLDQNELAVSRAEAARGKSESHWVVLARKRSDFGPLTGDARWRPLSGRPSMPVWTDDYTSLWGIAHW
jgi:hypothetical protein